MKRLVLIGVLLGAASGACGTTDDRPRTLEYITNTILAPNCASAQCHSAFKREVGDQFDTADAARNTIVLNVLFDQLDPEQSTLLKAITTGSPSVLEPGSGTLVRMPYDSPMPDADVELIRRWLVEDGAPGAQCLPNADGNGCSVTGTHAAPEYHVVRCVNGTGTSVVMDCPTTPKRQICSIVTGNGRCVEL
jgi:hypothetical protein